jgi:hypothetical protein
MLSITNIELQEKINEMYKEDIWKKY